MSAPDTFARWGVIASGGGGGKIVGQLLLRDENPGVNDRILLLNTHRSDLRNTLDRLGLDVELNEYGQLFGERRGVGNNFYAGEQVAKQSIEQISGRIDDQMAGAEGLLYVTALGGGTGNGSVPYVIDQFTGGSDYSGHKPWIDDAVHIALGVWPHYDEQIQRHFNAYCGLSRLLTKADGQQNADMTLLAANSHLTDKDGDSQGYEGINQRIISAIDLLIGAGQETYDVVDIEDYVEQPSNIAAYHFTPALATNINTGALDLENGGYEFLFDQAKEQTFVPMDVSTSRATYAIVRAPEQMIETQSIGTDGIRSAFNRWKRDNDIGGTPGMSTLIPKSGRGAEVDVMLLLGGFDLTPLLNHSKDKYESHLDEVRQAQQLGGGNSDSGIPISYIETLEQNLENYMSINSR